MKKILLTLIIVIGFNSTCFATEPWLHIVGDKFIVNLELFINTKYEQNEINKITDVNKIIFVNYDNIIAKYKKLKQYNDYFKNLFSGRKISNTQHCFAIFILHIKSKQ